MSPPLRPARAGTSAARAPFCPARAVASAARAALRSLGAVALVAFAFAPARAAAELAPDLRALEAQLRSREPEALGETLRAIARHGAASRPLRPLVEALAARGLPPPLARLALEALGAIGARESAPAARRYLRHRHADVRLAAARALGRAGGPVAVAALRGALADVDPGVRGEAASSLGALGAADAVDDLYRAFDRGVVEAGAAIGRVCPPSACAGLESRLSARPFAALAPACEALLWRPAAQIHDAQKVALVRRLHDLPPADVHHVVAGWRERWSGSAAVGEALARAAEATRAAPGRGD